MKMVSLRNKVNPTNSNAQKIRKAQIELTHSKKNKNTPKSRIRNLEKDKQSRIASQKVNEVNKRKGTLRAKLKAARHERKK